MEDYSAFIPDQNLIDTSFGTSYQPGASLDNPALRAHLEAQDAKFDETVATSKRLKKHRERCKRVGLDPFKTKASDLVGKVTDSYANHILPAADTISRLSTAFFKNVRTNKNGQQTTTFKVQMDVWTDPITVQHRITSPERKVFFNLQTGVDIKYKANGYVKGARVWKDGKQVRGDSLMTANQRDFYLAKVADIEAAMREVDENAVIYAGFCQSCPDSAARLGTKTICSQFVVLVFVEVDDVVMGSGIVYVDGKSQTFDMASNPNVKKHAPLMIGSFCVEQTTKEQFEHDVLTARFAQMRGEV